MWSYRSALSAAVNFQFYPLSSYKNERNLKPCFMFSEILPGAKKTFSSGEQGFIKKDKNLKQTSDPLG